MLPIILGVLLLGGGYFGYTKFMGGGPAVSAVEAQAKAEKKLETDKKQRRKDRIQGPVVTLGDPFVVNLADAGLSAFSKFSISLEVDKQSPMESAGEGSTDPLLLEETPQIRDTVIDVIGDKTSEELKTSSGRDAIKETLLEEINKRTEKTVALEVYFTDFAIQAS